MERQYEEARQGASGLHAAHEELRRAERERERRSSAQQEAALRTASRVARRDALDRERAALEEELAQARGGADSVAERAGQLERQAALLTEAAEAARAAEDTAQRLKDADARLADAAYRAGFDTPRAAADALLDDAAQRELQHRLDAWQTEEAAVRAALAEPDTVAAAQQPPADLAGAEQAASGGGTTAARGRLRARRRREPLHRTRPAVRPLGHRPCAGSAPLREDYDRVARLAGLTAGTSADNERRMRLESYVLAARLEQVAAAATARLQRMSSGRYTLVHSDDRAGRGRSGPRPARRRRLDRPRARHGHPLRRRDLLRLPRPGARPRRRGHRRGGRRPPRHPLHRRGLRQPRRPDARRGPRRPGLAARTRPQRRHRQPRAPTCGAASTRSWRW